MNSKRIKTTISIVIVIILCLLLSTLLYSIYSVQKMFDSLQAQVDTRTIIITLKDNLSILLNAETGERGYVITRNTNYLTPYNEARQKLTDNTALLDTMLRADTNADAALDSLKSYIKQKMSYIENIINLTATGNEEGVKHLLNTGQGQYIMDKVRDYNQKLQATEEMLFNDR